MAVTYTWNIADMERNTSDSMVSTVHWAVSANDGDSSAGAYGSVGLEPAEPGDMIPYEDLTPEVVIGWVHDRLGGPEKVSEIESSLEAQISEQKAPATTKGTPW